MPLPTGQEAIRTYLAQAELHVSPEHIPHGIREVVRQVNGDSVATMAAQELLARTRVGEIKKLKKGALLTEAGEHVTRAFLAPEGAQIEICFPSGGELIAISRAEVQPGQIIGASHFSNLPATATARLKRDADLIPLITSARTQSTDYSDTRFGTIMERRGIHPSQLAGLLDLQASAAHLVATGKFLGASNAALAKELALDSSHQVNPGPQAVQDGMWTLGAIDIPAEAFTANPLEDHEYILAPEPFLVQNGSVQVVVSGRQVGRLASGEVYGWTLPFKNNDSNNGVGFRHETPDTELARLHIRTWSLAQQREFAQEGGRVLTRNMIHTGKEAARLIQDRPGIWERWQGSVDDALKGISDRFGLVGRAFNFGAAEGKAK